jgi:hypothetical protein
VAVKLNTQFRHHAAHPPSAVKANLAINQKPNPAPEQASIPATPNPNPSLGPVGLDAVNSRKDFVDDNEDDQDEDTDEDDEDRKCTCPEN